MKNQRLNPKKLACLITVLLSGLSLSGQENARYRSDLPAIRSNGFYKVELGPELIGRAQASLADLRIVDRAGKPVSYAASWKISLGKTNLRSLQVVDDPAKSDSISSLVLENPGRGAINNLRVTWRNTEVKRNMALSGSDDLEHWYIIAEDLLPDILPGQPATGLSVFDVHFPFSNYRYYKLIVENGKAPGLGLLAGSTLLNPEIAPDYLLLPRSSWKLVERGNTTSVRLSFGSGNLVDKLRIEVAGPAYYSRQASVYAWVDGKRTLITNGLIRSGTGSELYLNVRSPTLEIDIANRDNAPLNITRVSAYQARQSVIAWLEKGQTYRLLFGDADARSPDYDLPDFNGDVPEIASISHGSVQKNPGFKPKSEPTRWIKPWMSWTALAAVLVLLLYLTLKMTHAVNAKSRTNKNS